MHDLPPQGSIDEMFPARLLAALHLREFDGSLRLVFADATKVLYFKKGEIVSAASNAEPDRLASLLIQDGRLTAEQLEMARSRQQGAASLGKTLIDMGFLTPTELLQGARRQVQVIVASCFPAGASGTYEMVPGPLPPEVTSLGLNTRRLLFDCLMETKDRGAIIREIGSMEAVYRPTERLDSILASLRLDSETDRIARLLNGTVTLRDISGRTSRDDFTVGKVILALDLLGAAERIDLPEPRLQAAGHGRLIPIEVEAPAPEEEPVSAAAADEEEPAIVIEDEPAESAPALQAGGPEPEQASVPGLAAADPETGETPPIPQEDLPAFAIPDTGPEAEVAGPVLAQEPHWEIDAVTGERVHVGPIEMTFDGRIAPGSGRSSSARRLLLAAAAAALVVSGALGYVLLRRGEGGSASAQPAASAAAETPAPGPSPEIVPEPPVIATRERPAEASPTRWPPAPTPAPPAARPRPESTPAPTPRSEPTRKAAIPKPAKEPAADPLFASAAGRIDQGDSAGAARQFASWIAQAPDRFTLQIMIACQDDTVRSARSSGGASAPLFILPYSLKGRACYRVCWGVFESPDLARAAAPAIPAALAGTSPPLVVPVARLRVDG